MYFLISSMVLGLLNQLQDLLIVISDGITRAFNRSGVTRTVSLNIFKAFKEFKIQVFFTNLSLMEFGVRYLALFHLFSAIVNFEWF